MLLLLSVLLVLPHLVEPTAPAELTGVVDASLTPASPSNPVVCSPATATDLARLPEGYDRRGRSWSCTLLCHVPAEERKALFIEQRRREPLLYVDIDRDGRFAPDERSDFRRNQDLLIRLPFSRGGLREYPVLVRHRWELFKQRGFPERRMLLQSPMAHFVGRVTVGGRSLRVEYPLSWDLGTPAVHGGWVRIDANGDGRIDEDPLSVESAPPRTDLNVLRVGNKYVSTVAIDPASRKVTLREHPASDYRRIEIREGDPLPDFTYTDLAGAVGNLFDIRSPLVLLVVWSSWCPPALTQLVHVEQTFRKLHPNGLAVLGLPHDTEPNKVRPLLESFGVTWPNTDSQSVRELLRDRWQVAGVPLMIVLDRDSRIVKVSRPGDLSLHGANLRRTLEQLLKRSHHTSLPLGTRSRSTPTGLF